MITQENINNIAGTTVYGNDGSKIGSAKQVYLDDQTGAPEWVTVNTGLFGTHESFIPLASANLAGDRLEVPFGKDMVKDAPRVGADGHLEPNEEDELYRYYGMSGTGTQTTDDRTTDTVGAAGTAGMRTDTRDDERGTVGHDTSGPTTDDAMTRSEERLDVGTEKVATGRARLRKHIVTENVTTTVPVEREEVRLEREPITDANRGDAMSGGDLTTEEHEVVLNEERVVVDKETVPVERVRLDKETVVENETVSDSVRKEEIDLDAADKDSKARR